MRVAYLGPVGSYTYLAASAMCPDAELVPCRDFDAVFAETETGACDRSVVPIENSVEGGVNQNMDLLIRTALSVVGEFELAIDNRVFTRKDHGEIARVVSHPQAYAQCRENVKRMFPSAVFEAASSTAMAISLIDAHTAAVAGVANAREGLSVSESVNDCAENTTRFYLLSREPEAGGEKLGMVFEAVNRPGGLLKVLSVFDDYGLNMTSIQSRPHKTQLGRYFFFVDVSGDLRDKNTLRAIEAARKVAPYFKLLGNFYKIRAASPQASKAEIAPCVSLDSK